MKPLTVLSAVLLFAVIVGGCSPSAEKKPGMMKEGAANVMHNIVTIKPSRSYEECVAVRPGMVVDYDYDASGFVNFNIHYHGPDEVHYPASKNSSMMGKGVIDPEKNDFYSSEQEYYCLMWDNLTEEPVKLSFTCVTKEKAGMMRR